MKGRRAWLRLALGALALVPCVVVALLVERYGGHVPLEDQWTTPGRLLEAQVDGTLGWRQLFAQHNEARKAFTGSLWLLLASGGWSTRLEMAASLALVAVGVAAYLVVCRRSGAAARARAGGASARGSPGDASPRTTPLLLAAVASVLLFHPDGFIGVPPPWLWGGNLENAVLVVALLGGLAANLCVASWPLRYALSAAASAAATYSFASGLALWLLLYPRWLGPRAAGAAGRPRPPLALDLLYGATFATVVVTYFVGYERPPAHPSFRFALGQPGQLTEFFVAWLGAPLAPRAAHLTAATAAGTATLLVFLSCLAQVAFRRLLTPALPFLLLAAYALASGAAAALGRSTFGSAHALAPRYVLHALVFHLAVNALLWLVATSGRGARRRPVARALFALVLALQLGLVGVKWVQTYPAHLRAHELRHARGEAALTFVEHVPDNPDLGLLHRQMPKFVPRFLRLVRAGVLDVDVIPAGEVLATADAAVDLGGVLSLAGGRPSVTVRGAWPALPATASVTHLVLRARSGGEERLVSTLPLAAFPRSRDGAGRAIEARISTANLPDGPVTLELLGVEAAARRLLPLRVVLEL